LADLRPACLFFVFAPADFFEAFTFALATLDFLVVLVFLAVDDVDRFPAFTFAGGVFFVAAFFLELFFLPAAPDSAAFDLPAELPNAALQPLAYFSFVPTLKIVILLSFGFFQVTDVKFDHAAACQSSAIANPCG
jgi:hypothetical protein